MNSINGFGSLGSLCNVSGCNNFAAVRPQAENSVPEQRDMVSLGQESPMPQASFQDLVSTSKVASQVSEPSSVAVSEKSPVAETSTSVDAGNGLRATMSNLGVLTLLDDPAIESLNRTADISDTAAASRQNTLAMINLNSMETILANGLISM